MANSTIALFAQASPLGSGAGDKSPLSNSRAAPTPRSQASKVADSEFSSAANQFSLVFGQAVPGPAASALGSITAALGTMISTEVLMPELPQSEAYQLLSADGNELPLLGNLLPGAVFQQDFASPALNQFIAQSDQALPQDNVELTGTSIASQAAGSSVEEDIAFWRRDPELAFVTSAAATADHTIGDMSAVTRPLPFDPVLNKSQTFGEGAGEVGQGRRPETLAMALTQLSETAQSGSAEEVSAGESLQTTDVDELADSQKLAASIAKQSEVAPPQLFTQLKLENRQTATMADTLFSQPGGQRAGGLNPLDSGRAGELYDSIGFNSARPIAPQNRGSSNSVESFVNVLLSIDTSAQSSPSINPALDQWKADQATRTLELERTDLAAKTPFAKVGVPFSQSGWGENVGKQLAMLMARNLDSAQIQLDPPELGPLQVKIQVNNDQVSLHFTTAHSMVKEALEGASVRLQEMFQDQGLELASLEVTEEQTGQEQSRHSQGQALEPNPRSSQQSANAEMPTGAGLLTLSADWRQDEGKIDYFI